MLQAQSIDLMCDLQEMRRNISQNAIVRRNALLKERQELVDLMIESGIQVGTVMSGQWYYTTIFSNQLLSILLSNMFYCRLLLKWKLILVTAKEHQHFSGDSGGRAGTGGAGEWAHVVRNWQHGAPSSHKRYRALKIKMSDIL